MNEALTSVMLVPIAIVIAAVVSLYCRQRRERKRWEDWHRRRCSSAHAKSAPQLGNPLGISAKVRLPLSLLRAESLGLTPSSMRIVIKP